MKTNSFFFKGALSGSLQMNAGAFIVLLLLTISQVGSIHAQTVPGVTWIRQYGTIYMDVSRGISAEGNIYVAGYTDGVFPGQTQYDPSGNGMIFDAYIAKYDPAGNQLWVRQFGTSGDDEATGIAIDGSGVYVTGYTRGVLAGTTNFGYQDAFIKKYDHSGNELWIVQFGTNDSDLPADAMGIDATGVYVIGRTWSAFPGYTNAGGVDIFIAKYSLDGTQLWITQKGTAATDWCSGICVDASGFYICGYDNSQGLNDYFISKYSLAGNEIWNHRFGTSGADAAQEISVDETALYISGYTNGTFPGQINKGNYDAFIAKHDLDGNMLWLREFGTTGTDYAYGNSAGTSDVYIVGFTTGTFPGQTNAGLEDVFTAKYNKDGDSLWIMETGSDNRDYAWTISVVSLNAYVNGYTNGTLPGQTRVGGSDPFVMEYLVQTPQEATLDLITEVEELVESGVLNQGQGNALIVKLQAAIQKMDQGNYKAAINNLNAFINQVNAFHNAGILSDEEAEGLIIAAQRIITVLEKLDLKQDAVIASGDLSKAETFQTWNYPNPFNSSTTIHYSLPMDVFVTLKIYNSSGEEVAVLVNDMQVTGTHTIAFYPDGLSSGIYYYRLQAGSYSVTKKLILLR